MHADSGACGYVGAVINKHASGGPGGYGFSNQQKITSRQVALADLDHIDPRGKRAFRELNQAGQVRGCLRMRQ